MAGRRGRLPDHPSPRLGSDPVWGAVGASPGADLGGGAAPGPELLFFDKFTNDTGASVAPEDHVPDVDKTGLGWTTTAAGFDVETQDYLGASGTTNALCYMDAGGVSEYIAEMQEVTPSGPTRGDQLFRYVDGDNFWILLISEGSAVSLTERTAGSQTTRGTTTTTISDGDKVYWSDDGETIKVGINRSAPEITFSSTQHSESQKMGLRGANLSWGCDNFQVWKNTTDPANLNDPGEI